MIKDFSSKSTDLISESEWYAGWIGYEFLKIDPNTYINHFLNSYENTEHIGEKAKSAYWVGKSYEKTNNKELKPSKDKIAKTIKSLDPKVKEAQIFFDLNYIKMVLFFWLL